MNGEPEWGGATKFRLDTVDSAIEAGWEVESTGASGKFRRGEVTIHVQYTDNDAVDNVVKTGPGTDYAAIEDITSDAIELLRSWLTGQSLLGGAPAASLPPADSGRDVGGWTRAEFLEAVKDVPDRAFLTRFLQHVAQNGQLRALGQHSRLYFGKKPSGGLFVYPFGWRHPPFKFLVSKDGHLLISGCWTGFPEVAGH